MLVIYIISSYSQGRLLNDDGNNKKDDGISLQWTIIVCKVINIMGCESCDGVFPLRISKTSTQT